MASINISLKKEAYERLVALKKPDESFSDEVLRLAGKKTGADLMKFWGAWKDMSEANFKIVEKAAAACRKGKISDITKKWES